MDVKTLRICMISQIRKLRARHDVELMLMSCKKSRCNLLVLLRAKYTFYVFWSGVDLLNRQSGARDFIFGGVLGVSAKNHPRKPLQEHLIWPSTDRHQTHGPSSKHASTRLLSAEHVAESLKERSSDPTSNPKTMFCLTSVC